MEFVVQSLPDPSFFSELDNQVRLTCGIDHNFTLPFAECRYGDPVGAA